MLKTFSILALFATCVFAQVVTPPFNGSAASGGGVGGANNLTTPGDAVIVQSTGVVTQTASLNTVALCDKGGEAYCVLAYGVLNNGTDQSANLLAAFAQFPAGANIYFPAGTYKTTVITVKAGQTITLDPGATIIALAGGSPNTLFNLGTSPLSSTSLTTALQGTTSIVVGSTTGYVIGDRIIVSSGTFTGSGTEEGPLEFNTVSAIPDATHLTLTTPLKYNYSTFGIAGASPEVLRLGATWIHNVRITGGTIQPDAAFNSIYFLFTNPEQIEIDHIHMVGLGNGISTGDHISQLNFHDNIVSGAALAATGSGLAMATMVDSRVIDNNFSISNEGTGGAAFNHFICEVTCRDNLIQGNKFWFIVDTGSAAIHFDFNSFNNTIIENRIYGVAADVTAGHGTLGISTYANSSITFGGNLISRNIITDILVAIGDVSVNSVITANSHLNSTTNASSATLITSDNNTTIWGQNSMLNINRPAETPSSTNAGFSIFSGTATPSGNAGVGAVYFQNGGAAGQSAWFRENVSGTPTWLQRNNFTGNIEVDATTNLAAYLFRPAATSTQTTDMYIGRSAASSQALGIGFRYNSTAASAYGYMAMFGFTDTLVIGADKVGIHNSTPAQALDVTGNIKLTGIVQPAIGYTFTANHAIDSTAIITSPVSFATGFGCGSDSIECMRITPNHGVSIGNGSVSTDPGAGNLLVQNNVTGATYSTATNCANGASPAVCAAAAAGAVAIPTGTNPTLVVNTTAVTANSRIHLQVDDTVTIAATTCNSTLAQLIAGIAITARTAATSFTISYNGVITTNPVCVSYWIEN